MYMYPFLMTEETDYSAIGIIDESTPEEPEAADADYVRDDNPGESDNPPDDLESSEETEDVAAANKDDTADAQSDEPDKDTQDDGEGGEDGIYEDGPVTLAGVEYASLEEADQAIRSWDGRLKSANETIKARDTALSDYYEYVQNVGRENEELRAQHGTPPEGTEDAAPVTPTEVDMTRVMELAKLAELQGAEPMEALAKIYDMESKKIMDAKLVEMEERLSAPMEEMATQATEAQAERELFAWAQNEVDEDGDIKYPMLQQEHLDPDFIGNVYEAWSALGKKFGAAYAYSQVGIDYAYSLAQDYALDSGEYEEQGVSEDEPSGVSQAREYTNADAEVASDLTGETPVLDRPKLTAGKAALKELQDMKEVSFDDGESLGFYQ